MSNQNSPHLTPEQELDVKKKNDEAKAKEAKEAKAKEAKEAKAKEAKAKELENNSVDFVRKDLRDGIYTCNGPKGKIEIRGRSHYYSNIQIEVDFLNSDPEIVVFDPGKKNKNKK